MPDSSDDTSSPQLACWAAVAAELVARRAEAQRRRAVALMAEARAARVAAGDRNMAPERPAAAVPFAAEAHSEQTEDS